MPSVSKTYVVSAAHALRNMPEGHPCRNTHGHNYRFTVEVHGPIDRKTGMVMDYHVLDRVVSPIVARIDHQDVNEVLSLIPTAENLARWLQSAIMQSKDLPVPSSIDAVWNIRVHCDETERTRATYP